MPSSAAKKINNNKLKVLLKKKFENYIAKLKGL